MNEEPTSSPENLGPEPAREEFNWYLSSVQFSGGDEVAVAESSLCIFIGPNSSGKSSALRGIQQHLQQNTSSPVIRGIRPERAGDALAMQDWLDRRFPRKEFAGKSYWSVKGQHLPTDNVASIWGQGTAMPGAQAFLVHLLDTDNRLSATKQTRAIDVYEQPAEQYIHVLQANDDLAQQARADVFESFQTDLVIDWTGGHEVRFRVGTEPPRDVESDRVSSAYASALRQLPRLDEAGDGLRSFVGAVLALRCGSHPVLLIDEPEAFLHPPQARRLGALLARVAVETRRQVFIATHSADIVRGALDGPGEVAVCRVTRDGGANRAAVLPSSGLRELWSRPLLRSVSAISGLFHRGVVVCEADADARFYEMTLRGMEAAVPTIAMADLHFAQGGGKGELATLARAYRGVQVPVAVVADLDLIRNRGELVNVLGALGVDLAPYEGRYRSLLNNLGTLPPRRSTAEFVEAAREVLNQLDTTTPAITSESKRQIVDLLDGATDWSAVKRIGIAALRGPARTEAESLLKEWADLGLFLVPVGELEGWWPQGPTSKSHWIDEALAQAARNDLPEVGSFMQGVAAFLSRTSAPESRAR